MNSGDFCWKNSHVHNGRQLPDDQDELKITPMGDIHREDWMEYEIWEPAAHRSQVKYHNLGELLLDRTWNKSHYSQNTEIVGIFWLHSNKNILKYHKKLVY